ncbi:MAG: hypothetical protein IT201_03905 [Thermoleophilia bacterium]|nr:hypothetical protein [Thermoleophilia bacterium]
MGSQARHPGVRRVLPSVCLLALVLAATPASFAQEPPVTVPVAPDPAPSPDPVPDDPEPPPAPPASPGGDTSPPPPAVSAPPEPSGPTAAELREQREAERQRLERERKRREQRAAERERKRLLALRARMEEIWTSGVTPFDGAANAPGAAAPAAAPVLATEPHATETPPSGARTIEPEPAAQASPSAALQPAGNPSSLAGAAPVLLGLFGLAVLLLGVAAIPPWSVRSSAVAGLLAARRLELGLIGAAVLASAAIGLVVAILAGG